MKGGTSFRRVATRPRRDGGGSGNGNGNDNDNGRHDRPAAHSGLRAA